MELLKQKLRWAQLDSLQAIHLAVRKITTESSKAQSTNLAIPQAYPEFYFY